MTSNARYYGVHLFRPYGRKAYTVSVLNILKENDMVDHTEGQIKSGQDFYSNLLQFQYQKRKSNGHRQKQSSNKRNTANDRNIRPQSYYRASDMQYNTQRYSVPTSNMYDHLNY